MFGFDLNHIRDPNNYSTGSHAIKQQTSSPPVQLGLVVATDPVKHTADVKLLGYRGNGNTPMVLQNIRVPVNSGGDGWGESNLPWIGQQVEVVFENGISFSPSKAFIGRRFYTNAHKPPSHPIFLDNSYYQKGSFEQAEGGTYKFKKADGSVTEFGATTRSKEGSKENTRATGVAKTSSESLMETSQQKTALAHKQLDRVTKSSNNLADLVQQRKQLLALEAAEKFSTRRPEVKNSQLDENNKIEVWLYNISSATEADLAEAAIASVSSNTVRQSFVEDELRFLITKSTSNQAYFTNVKTALSNNGFGISGSAIRKGTNHNSQGNIPNIRIVVQ